MNKETFENRVLASLSHVSAIIYTMGLIVPIVIWVTQKDKSKYVRFQALQAIFFQLSMIGLLFVGMILYMGSFVIMMVVGVLGSSQTPANSAMPVLFLIPFGTFFLLMIAFLLLILYGIYGAVSTFQGRDFEYIILGPRVRKSLD